MHFAILPKPVLMANFCDRLLKVVAVLLIVLTVFAIFVASANPPLCKSHFKKF